MINFICNRFNQTKDGMNTDSTETLLHELKIKREYTITQLSDIVKNKKYYFIIHSLGYPSHELKHNNSLPDTIVTLINEGYDINIILMTFHETDTWKCLEDFEEFFSNKNIDLKRIYFYSGNSVIENYKNKINSKITVFPNKFIPFAISRQMYLDGKLAECKEDRISVFQCYNRNMKEHRIATLCGLYVNNILPITDWSNMYGNRLKDYRNQQGEWDFWHKNGTDRKIVSDDKIIDYNEGLNYLLDMGNYKSPEENFEFDQGGPQHNLSYQNNIYKNAYFNIVTETQFEWPNTIHITEKTLQPFYFYQIPIIVGTYKHCAKVKELYDLDFFEDIVDLSFDKEENDEKRFNMIMQEIKRISQIDKEEIRKLFNKKDILKRLYKNRHKVELIQFDEYEHKFFDLL